MMLFRNAVLLVSDYSTTDGLLTTNLQYPTCPILHMASVGSREGEKDLYTKSKQNDLVYNFVLKVFLNNYLNTCLNNLLKGALC